MVADIGASANLIGMGDLASTDLDDLGLGHWPKSASLRIVSTHAGKRPHVNANKPLQPKNVFVISTNLNTRKQYPFLYYTMIK